MSNEKFWTPTALEYYECLNTISPNYSIDNFKRD